MSEFQTVVNDLYVMRGNALLEIAPYVPADPFAWTPVGAIKELSVEEELSIAKEENDNADSIERVSKQTLKIKFTQLEIFRIDVWQAIRGGLDTVVEVAPTTTISSGNKTALPFFAVRLTTKNDGKPFYLIAFKCQTQKGFSFSYQKDDSDDRRIQNPIELIAKADSNRSGYVWEMESDGWA